MNVALSSNWTARQEERYEYDGVRPVAMAGSTATLNRISQSV
jgi:hypothetical protein